VLPDETIPLLVKKLVDAGCAIRRVGPAGQPFSMAIRNEYLRKPSAPDIDKEE
jgi:hypothetical protein